MEIQIEDLTTALFHVEVEHYRELAPDADTLHVWLAEYRVGITRELKKFISDDRQDFHLPSADRIAIVERVLDAKINEIKPRTATSAKSSGFLAIPG